MDALLATLSRIDQIRTLTGAVAPPAPRTAGPSQPSFAALLSEASAATPSAAVSGSSAAYGPVQNGRLPDAALTPIGSGHRLTGAAAASFEALRAAAAQAGVQLEVNSSYRTFRDQVRVAREKGLYASGGLAARPGTSTHGMGLSIDLGLDGRAQEWMHANAARFGFSADVAREPWHWTFRQG